MSKGHLRQMDLKLWTNVCVLEEPTLHKMMAQYVVGSSYQVLILTDHSPTYSNWLYFTLSSKLCGIKVKLKWKRAGRDKQVHRRREMCVLFNLNNQSALLCKLKMPQFSIPGLDAQRRWYPFDLQRPHLNPLLSAISTIIPPCCFWRADHSCCPVRGSACTVCEV